MTKFNFLIKQNIKDSWSVLKSNFWVFFALTLLIFIINCTKLFFTNSNLVFDIALFLVVLLLTFLFVYITFSISIFLHRKKEKIKFSSIISHLPRFKDYFYFLLVSIIPSILALVISSTLGIFVLLFFRIIINLISSTSIFLYYSSFILGILVFFISFLYLNIKTGFSALVYLEKKKSIIYSIKKSWLFTNNNFWIIFGHNFFIFFIYIITFFILFLLNIFVLNNVIEGGLTTILDSIVVLFLYPISVILFTGLYSKLYEININI